MGYSLNCLDETVFMAVPKPLLTEFGIHNRLESCAKLTISRQKIRLFGFTEKIIGLIIKIKY